MRSVGCYDHGKGGQHGEKKSKSNMACLEARTNGKRTPSGMDTAAVEKSGDGQSDAEIQ